MIKLKYILYCLVLCIVVSPALTLDKFIQTNVYTNPQVQSSVENYKATLYELESAKAAYNPTLDLKGEYGKENTEIASSFQGRKELNEKQLRVLGKYNLFEGFKTKHKVNEKKAAVEVSKNKVFQQVNQVSLLMIQVYLEVLRRDRLLTIERRNLTNHLETLEKVKIRLGGGDGYESDFRQTKARVKLAETTKLIVERQYKNAEINYRKFMRSFPNTKNLSSPIVRLNTSVTSIEKLVEKANKDNYKVKAQTSEVRVAKAYHRQQRSKYYPTVDLEVSKAWNDNVHGFQGRDDSSKVAVVFNYNLYNGGADKASELAALRKSDMSSYGIDEIQLDIEEQVRTTVMQYELLETQEELLAEQLELLKGTQELYEIEYQHNKRTIIDVLNIKQEYAHAEAQKVNAFYDKMLIYYQFKSAMGALVEEFDLEDVLDRL